MKKTKMLVASNYAPRKITGDNHDKTRDIVANAMNGVGFSKIRKILGKFEICGLWNRTDLYLAAFLAVNAGANKVNRIGNTFIFGR